MTAQSLENEFNKYWPLLSYIEKESLLIVAKNYVQLKSDSGDFDVEQYNKEIDDAVERVENGEFFTHDEVVKMSKDW